MAGSRFSGDVMPFKLSGSYFYREEILSVESLIFFVIFMCFVVS